MISKRSIERVRETAKVEEIVSNFVNLKRRGVNLIGNCPFHNEKTPSFIVSPSKNIYKCFGCNKSGDAFRFVMDHEGYSYIEAVRYVAKYYRIELEEIEATEEQKLTEQKEESLFIVSEWAKKKFSKNLFETQAGLNIGLAYFKERGYRENIIKKYDLGFSSDGDDDLTSAAKYLKHNIEFLKEIGLTTSSEKDFFRNRVMFTIHNLSGKAIGFAGRIMGNQKNLPKYINSPESPIYNKRKTLYGLYFAKNEIRKKDFSYLVEGYTDVLSMVQAGVENVVASAGTSLTSEQIQLLKRYSPNIKVLYDGDSAGVNAALRGLEMLLEEEMTVKLILLPENHDPDSFIREVGEAGFAEFVEKNQKDFVLFKTQLLLQNTKHDPIQKAQALKDIINTLAKVKDTIIRSMYVKECSQLLDTDEKIIYSEINKILRKEIKDRNLKKLRETETENNLEIVVENETTAPSQKIFISNDEYQERELIRVMMIKGDKIYDKNENIPVLDHILSETEDITEYFEDSSFRTLIESLREMRLHGQFPDNDYYIHHIDKKISDLFIEFSFDKNVYADWSKKGLELQTQLHPDLNHVHETDQAILRINYQKINKIIIQNQTKLKAKSESDNEYFLLLKLHTKLLEQKKMLAQLLNIVVK